MRSISRKYLAILAFWVLPNLAAAEDYQFTEGDQVRLDPNLAYIAARSHDIAKGGLRGTVAYSVVLYRLLTAAELDRYKAQAEQNPNSWQETARSNVTILMASKAYSRVDGEALMIVAAEPGTYVLGGMTAANWASTTTGGMIVSLAMGTVKFDAKPGVITDLGTILNAIDNRPTDIPELKNVVIGRENELNFSNAVAIRPAQSSTPLPSNLTDLTVVPADYRATPAFPNYARAALGRLAPLPGVMTYDRNGDVVDLKEK